MRVGILRFAGTELLARIGELIAGNDHLLGAKALQGEAGLFEGGCAPFFTKAIGVEVPEKEAEAFPDRTHAAIDPGLPIDLGPKALLGPYDAVGPVLFFLGKAREAQKARGSDGQGE